MVKVKSIKLVAYAYHLYVSIAIRLLFPLMIMDFLPKKLRTKLNCLNVIEPSIEDKPTYAFSLSTVNNNVL